MRVLFRPRVLMASIFMGAAIHAHASDGLEYLAHFLKNTKAGQAHFTQTVKTPVRSDNISGGKQPSSSAAVLKTENSTGTFAFQRPGQLRFEYKKPFAQTIVADGQYIWLHDHDLEQVSRRTQAALLQSTPAALLVTAGDVPALRQHFELRAQTASAADAPIAHWVQATPKNQQNQLDSANSTITQARIGFDLAGQLKAIEMQDAFGQTSRLTLDVLQLAPALPAATFTFTPPPGVAVVQQ